MRTYPYAFFLGFPRQAFTGSQVDEHTSILLAQELATGSPRAQGPLSSSVASGSLSRHLTLLTAPSTPSGSLAVDAPTAPVSEFHGTHGAVFAQVVFSRSPSVVIGCIWLY